MVICVTVVGIKSPFVIGKLFPRKLILEVIERHFQNGRQLRGEINDRICRGTLRATFVILVG